MRDRTQNKEQQKLNEHHLRLFRRFLAGGILMISCLIGVFMLNIYLEPSKEQEICALIALIGAGIGGVIALTGYIGLMTIRFRQFIERD
ncbi:MAG: hypothetical protein CSB48_01130 [Proteobacteria bacterium]|nr:MAG: hypothetical protein CSB48_01130 [Pseudomonadota bacterium]PIE39881.1 MAG: hypothetical protein CSA51_03760 [Gammaproteobacteria bacterium]